MFYAAGEKEGSRDIYPNADGQYLLLEEGEMKVYAAPLVHTVPCVGFVVAENDRPGRLRVEKIAPLVEKNKDALKTKLGLTDANKAYAILKVRYLTLKDDILEMLSKSAF
jgi:ribonuclease BN (tRNA processing enzyme)